LPELQNEEKRGAMIATGDKRTHPNCIGSREKRTTDADDIKGKKHKSWVNSSKPPSPMLKRDFFQEDIC